MRCCIQVGAWTWGGLSRWVGGWVGDVPDASGNPAADENGPAPGERGGGGGGGGGGGSRGGEDGSGVGGVVAVGPAEGVEIARVLLDLWEERKGGWVGGWVGELVGGRVGGWTESSLSSLSLLPQ